MMQLETVMFSHCPPPKRKIDQRVEKEQLVKSAALSHTSPAKVKSVLGQLLVKTAAAVREEAGNSEISYADLARFQKTYAG